MFQVRVIRPKAGLPAPAVWQRANFSGRVPLMKINSVHPTAVKDGFEGWVLIVEETCTQEHTYHPNLMTGNCYVTVVD